MKLFKALCCVYSPSGGEGQLIRFITNMLRRVDGVTWHRDAMGNLLITKGRAQSYPCIAAHLDQVQRPYPSDYRVTFDGYCLRGWSPSMSEPRGLGADDKCGVWIALKLLKELDAVKVAFFVGEEIGCIGSSSVSLDFFSDCRFVLQADRRGAHDIITCIGGTELCSADFLTATSYEAYGYTPTTGLITDVGELKERGLPISCINVSCGYYEPHTEREIVIWSDMVNTLNFFRHVCNTCVEVYPHEAPDEAPDIYDYNNYYNDAYFAILEDYYNNPEITPGMWLASWGDIYPDITIEEVTAIINELKEYNNEEEA